MSYHDPVLAALSEGGPIARALPGFVARQTQQALALAVADTIEAAQTLIAEAGTGTGKTFAYLVPALLSGARVLIATGSRNLQDQLFGKDLPQVLRSLGLQVPIAILKGRSNYVCHYHLERNLNTGRLGSREEAAALRRIGMYAKITQVGDRAGLSTVAEDSGAWYLATSTRENCLGQDCPDYSRCFVFKARQAAQQADVVVVNHHLFCADLALRDEGVSELLPTTQAIIFDEAHQLPEVATQFFGAALALRQVLDFGRDTVRAGQAEAKDSADWLALWSNCEQVIREVRLHAGQPARLDGPALAAKPTLLQALVDLRSMIGVLGSQLERAQDRGRELARCALRATELGQNLDDWLAALQQAQGADNIVWAEVGQSSLTLHTTPLSVALMLQRHREETRRAWIFLSATLAVGPSLDLFAGQVGCEDARKEIFASPFDYPSQGLLYVPAGMPVPQSPEFAQALFDAAWPLIQANAGRCFVLCTTLRMVQKFAQLLRDQLEIGSADAAHTELADLQVLVQGEASKPSLMQQFRESAAPVLIGSASFWEGVDVAGQQLSLVIIDKLPFAPPDDPVLAARMKDLKARGGDPFRELQLPQAAMALKQGAGRLIRSERDRGLLMVGDARLADKPYGRSLLRSLPPFQRTRDAQMALQWCLDQGRPITTLPTSDVSS